jgi:hypothetical protein
MVAVLLIIVVAALITVIFQLEAIKRLLNRTDES